MFNSATIKNQPVYAVVIAIVMAMVAIPATAQDSAAELGDDFIFFFDGPNVLLPRIDGQTVADPLDQSGSNRVSKYNYGNWSAAGFFWQRDEGVDMTANVSDTPGEGDTLFVSMLVDPANAGKPGLSLTMFDKTNDIPAQDESADLEFRLQWEIPEDLRDGAWHDLAIPLPPTTTVALDSAKAGVDVNGDPLSTPLDDNAKNWVYGGAWSVGGFGVWAPGDCVGTACFQEFQWEAVHGLSVFMDTDQGGGPVYLDNVYIGGPGTDVSQASDVPAAMSGVSFSSDGEENIVSWTHNPDFGGYNIYVSETEIDATAVLDGSAKMIGSVPFNATDFEVRHSVDVPHPSLSPMPLYYAVTSTSQFGVENADVSASSDMVANEQLPKQPYIVMATDDEANVIFDNVASGVISDDGFPDVPPFRIDDTHWKAGDAPLPDDNTDMSASVKITMDSFGFMYVYAEVTDDVMSFAGTDVAGIDTWNFDALELAFGTYDVREAGGTILTGSPHNEFQRGDVADYQMRFAAQIDDGGSIAQTSVYYSTDPNGSNPVNGQIQGSGGVSEVMADGSGWRMLVAFPLESIIDPSQDVPFEVPGENEVILLPFNIAFNDADATGSRESQVIWSTRDIAGAGWWNTPSHWLTTAVAGRATATDTEDHPGELPLEFTLEQNYPNPFNPSTAIEFSLAKAERVNLTVYNILGQRVATLLAGDAMPAGRHSVSFDASDLTSGMYIYRLEAGSSFSRARTMMLLK